MLINITKIEVQGDEVTVTGEVEGATVQARAWQSHLDGLPDAEARRLYLAECLAQSAQTLPAEAMEELTGPCEVSSVGS